MLSIQFLIAAAAAWIAGMGFDETEKEIRWCWRAISVLLVIISVIVAFGG